MAEGPCAVIPTRNLVPLIEAMFASLTTNHLRTAIHAFPKRSQYSVGRLWWRYSNIDAQCLSAEHRLRMANRFIARSLRCPAILWVSNSTQIVRALNRENVLGV